MTPLSFARRRVAEYKQYEDNLLAHPEKDKVRQAVQHFFEGLIQELNSLVKSYPEYAKPAQYEIDRINNILAKYEDNQDGN